MFKRNNRKGFTLAELLIVVAIIAVLVAIAVPLFVGALNDAEKRVGEANCRAVRGAAVEEILMDPYRETTAKKNYGTTSPWHVTATVKAGGEIVEMKITVGAGTLPTEGYTKIGNDSVYKKDGTDYKIELIVRELTAALGS